MSIHQNDYRIKHLLIYWRIFTYQKNYIYNAAFSKINLLKCDAHKKTQYIYLKVQYLKVKLV